MKRLFVVASEGDIHESLYFNSFRPGKDENFRLKVLTSGNRRSDPIEVVQRLVTFEREHNPGPETQYWALVDKAGWSESKLEEAWGLIRKRTDYYLAVSNPCFELWLWLHLYPNRYFDDRRHCQLGLGHQWPPYTSGSYDASPLLQNAVNACDRARALEGEIREPWPKEQGTRVRLLVEQLVRHHP